MNSRLNHVQDWLSLAKQANWSVTRLAKQCGVSVRALERHFGEVFKRPPKAWISEQRQQCAFQLLQDRNSVKEVAIILGYQHGHHFSREFKKYWGYSPAASRTTMKKPGVKCRV